MKEQYLFSRIGYTYLPTTKIDESIQWYTENLGLKLMNKFEDRGSYIAVLHYPDTNAIALLLVETADYKPLALLRNGKDYPVMAMNCPDIAYTHKKLIDNGVEAQDIQVLGEGEAKYFYFKDNAGNLLEAAWSSWDPVFEVKEDF